MEYSFPRLISSGFGCGKNIEMWNKIGSKLWQNTHLDTHKNVEFDERCNAKSRILSPGFGDECNFVYPYYTSLIIIPSFTTHHLILIFYFYFNIGGPGGSMS